MDAAQSYEEWKAAAIAHDKASGVKGWVTSDESKHFDFASIFTVLEMSIAVCAELNSKSL